MAKFTNTLRFHVALGERRTTVSMDKVLSDFLALHFGKAPGSPEAHTAIRAWAQRELDGSNDPGRIAVSQWLAGQALVLLARPELVEAWMDLA